MRYKLAVMAIGTALFLSPAVNADTFNFGSCTGTGLAAANCPNADAGTTSITYTNGVLSVTATSHLVSKGPAPDLYVKQAGANETGLGTAPDKNFEINTSNFINLDLSNLVAHNIFSGTLTIQSLQTGEGYKVCQGGSVGSLGSLSCKTGTGTSAVTLNLSWTGGTNDIIGITALNFDNRHPAANVLLAGLNTPVPEPGSLVLFCSGLLTLAGVIRRRISA